jgi:hypothetical protein
VLAVVCGQLLGVAALGVGEISVIELLLATNLLFALLFARW